MECVPGGWHMFQVDGTWNVPTTLASPIRPVFLRLLGPRAVTNLELI